MSKLKYLIFDVDGVLSNSGEPMSAEMIDALQYLVTRVNNEMSIVTGGYVHKFVSRNNHIPEFGCLLDFMDVVYGCLGNEILVPHTGHYFIRNYAAYLREQTRYYLRDYWTKIRHEIPGVYEDFTNCFERRYGMVNFSFLRRTLPMEDKLRLMQRIDRENICSDLSRYQNVFIGGVTSIDFSDSGKEQVFFDLKERRGSVNFDNLDVHFFGDRIDKFGNDSELAQVLLQYGGSVHKVNSPRDTFAILNDMAEGKLPSRTLEYIG